MNRAIRPWDLVLSAAFGAIIAIFVVWVLAHSYHKDTGTRLSSGSSSVEDRAAGYQDGVGIALIADKAHLAFGESFSLHVAVPPPSSGKVSIRECYTEAQTFSFFVSTDGKDKHTLLGVEGSHLPQRMYLARGVLNLTYERLFLLPGRYLIEFRFRQGDGSCLKSPPVTVEVEPAPNHAKEVDSFRNMMLSCMTDEHVVPGFAGGHVPGLQWFCRRTPDIAIEAILPILRGEGGGSPQDVELQKRLCVDMLTSLADDRAAKEFGFRRTTIPIAELVKLIEAEKSQQIRYGYLMGISLQSDLIQDAKEWELLKAMLLRQKESKTDVVRFAACVNLVNPNMRAQLGVDVTGMEASIREDSILSAESKAILLKYAQAVPSPTAPRSSQ